MALIGIMVFTKRMRKKILKKYDPFRNELEIQLFSFTTKDINWKEKRIRGLAFINNQWEEKMFPFPNAIYNLCYKRKANVIRRLEQYIGKNTCFNHITFFNKWSVYEFLSNDSKLNTYLPDTYLYNPEIFREWLTNEERLIIKPCYGSLGKRVFLVEFTKDRLYKIYQDTYTPIFISGEAELFYEKVNQLVNNRKYIMQKEIKLAKVEGKLFDLRILVQKDIHGNWIVTNCISRIAYKNFFVTNCSERVIESHKILEPLFHTLLEKEKADFTQTIHEICIKAAKILDDQLGLLGEIGFDMAIDTQGKLWILEVNGRPQKFLYRMLGKETDLDTDLVYKRPMEYAFYLSQKELK